MARSDLAADLARARQYGDALSPGAQAVVVYRFGHWLLQQQRAARLFLDPLYAILAIAVRVLWGIEISRHARIGAGLYIAHAGGLVIAKNAVLGANCNLSHDVTIGRSGHGESYGVPVIGDDVYIAPGAKLFGKIRVGNNVKIGANAVVHRDVPDNAVVASPGFQIVSFKGNRRRAPLQKAS
jgi:serine O-acetyltransferase